MNEKNGGFDTHFTFTDQEKDAESGLLYYGARYYHPVLGRFLQADPVVRDNVGRKEFSLALANPQLLNGYSYVGNNPVKNTDTEGEFIDTILDIGFIAYDLYSLGSALYKGEAIKGELVSLGLDVGGALIPGVTGLGMMNRVAKVANKVEHVAEAARAVEKVEDVVKVGGKVDEALYYAQKTIGPKFGEIGPFAKQRLSDVVGWLRNGTASADQLPIEYIVRDGKKAVLNNRSLNVLERAGKEPTKLIDRTGIPYFEEVLKDHLRGTEPSRFIRVRGAGSKASLIR